MQVRDNISYMNIFIYATTDANLNISVLGSCGDQVNSRERSLG